MVPNLNLTFGQMLFGQDMFNDLTQAKNWRQHVFGELALITSRPPEAYASGFLHQFFVDGRLILVKRSALKEYELD